MVLHSIEAPLPQMKAQADVIVQATAQTEEALKRFGNLRREASSRTGSRSIGWRTRATSSTGGRSPTCSAAITRAMDVLKWKEIIETLEEALDALENVANVIEAVTLKHA